MAEALASAGAHVVLNARSTDALEGLRDELTANGHSVSIACFDVTDESALREQVNSIEKCYGRLDVLVNNASAGRPGTLEDARRTDFEQLYLVNVVAPFQFVQAAMSLLKEAARQTVGGASVVNIGSMYGSVSPDPSIYGQSGAKQPAYYGAAKAGMIQFTRYAACHLAEHRIRVNCISPGPFPAQRVLDRDPGFHERLSSKNPMHRTGDPTELRGPLLFWHPMLHPT
jgi:NAD(P)-dependent dehydrogenase (short-subunit alcohol dehydrogenase family)